MIFPKITLRRLFLLFVVVAAFFSVARFAYLGQPWAIAVSISFLFLILVLTTHAFLYLVCSILGLSFSAQAPEPLSPFAETREPPQKAIPQDPSLE